MSKKLFRIKSEDRYHLYDGPNFSSGPLDQAPEADDDTEVIEVETLELVNVFLKNVPGVTQTNEAEIHGDQVAAHSAAENVGRSPEELPPEDVPDEEKKTPRRPVKKVMMPNPTDDHQADGS